MSVRYENRSNPEQDAKIQDYYDEIALLALLFLQGEITRAVFTSEHIRLTELAIVDNLIVAGGELFPPPESTLRFLREQRNQTRISAGKLADDIEAGLYDEQVDRDGIVTRSSDEGAASLATRLLLWTFVAGKGYVAGQLTRPPQLVRVPGGELQRIEPHFRWTLGPTEHCGSCFGAAQNGVQPQSFWDNLAAVGIRPQSQDLECHGYNCQCGLTEVPIESLINIGIVEA